MTRLTKRNTRELTRRVLKLETLEQREVFAVGGLDPTFGFGLGKTTTDFGGSLDKSEDCAFQLDGKIVVVGTTTAGGGHYNFALARYNSDGSLDASFGGLAGIGAGRVVTDFAAGEDQAKKVLIQPDGKILVIGWTNPFGVEFGEIQGYEDQPFDEHRWAVARYNSDGSMDNSFGVLGKVVAHRPRQEDVVDPAGAFLMGDKLLLVSANANSSLITRLNLSDGSLDASFGIAGHIVAETPIAVRAAALHGDGIVVAGYAKNGSGMAFSRIHMDGTVDSSFGINGLANVGPELSAQLYSVVVNDDGTIVGAGEYAVVRMLANGMPDATFSVDGVVSFEGSKKTFYDVAMDNNGTVIAAGNSQDGSNFVIARIGSDGAPDQYFGIGGLVTVDFGIGGFSNDFGLSVLTYANGNILVAGFAELDFGLTRINGSAKVNDPFVQVGLAPQLVSLQQSNPHAREAFLSYLVQQIDQAISEYRAEHPGPAVPSSASTSRNPGSSRTSSLRVLDELFAAELADDSEGNEGSKKRLLTVGLQYSF